MRKLQQVANMFSEEFRVAQQAKNLSGAPKYVVCNDVDSTGDELFHNWLEKWRDKLSYLDNTGCSCCINTYDFDAPDEALAELPIGMVTAYKEE